MGALHAKLYGNMPPLMVFTLADPFAAPRQVSLEAVAVMTSCGPWLSVKLAVAVQPFTSVTVTE